MVFWGITGGLGMTAMAWFEVLGVCAVFFVRCSADHLWPFVGSGEYRTADPAAQTVLPVVKPISDRLLGTHFLVVGAGFFGVFGRLGVLIWQMLLNTARGAWRHLDTEASQAGDG